LSSSFGARSKTHRILAALVAWSLTLGLAPVAVADTADEIARAEAELNDLQRRAEALAHRIEENWERQIALELQVAALVAAQAFVELEFATALGDLQNTAVRLYMDVASGEGFSAMLVSDDEMYAAAFQYLSTVAKDSEDAMNRLSAVAADLDRHRSEIEVALANQANVDAALMELALEVTEALDAQAVRLRELEELRAQEIFLATSTTTTTPPTDHNDLADHHHRTCNDHDRSHHHD
jgi:chromosome segregation ATPase